MKKNNGMMFPKIGRASKTPKLVCCVCGKELTPSTAYYYVDESNYAITNSAPPHCYECGKEKYKW